MIYTLKKSRKNCLHCLHETNTVYDWLNFKPHTTVIGQGIWNVFCDHVITSCNEITCPVYFTITDVNRLGCLHPVTACKLFCLISTLTKCVHHEMINTLKWLGFFPHFFAYKCHDFFLIKKYILYMLVIGGTGSWKQHIHTSADILSYKLFTYIDCNAPRI